MLPRRLEAYSPAWLDELCAIGEVVWVGPGAGSGRSGRVALYFRDDAAMLGPPPAHESPRGELHEVVRERLAGGACFFTDLLLDHPELTAAELREALWDLVWSGEVTNDAFAPLRLRRAASRVAAAAPAARRPARGRFRGHGRRAPQMQGRWSLTAAVFGRDGTDQGARARAWAELLLERHGIVTREIVRAEAVAGGFAALYPAFAALETLGAARRGYFVSRGSAPPSSPCRARSTACALPSLPAPAPSCWPSPTPPSPTVPGSPAARQAGAGSARRRLCHARRGSPDRFGRSRRPLAARPRPRRRGGARRGLRHACRRRAPRARAASRDRAHRRRPGPGLAASRRTQPGRLSGGPTPSHPDSRRDRKEGP